MSMNEKGARQPISILHYPCFPSATLFQGTFNRYGGMSPPPWDSNNVSLGVGDSPENISANRELLKINLGCRHLVSARQVHGTRIYIAEEIPAGDLEVEGYDGLMTDIPGLGLMVQQADCQAVLLFDPVRKAVAIVHVGWRGSVAAIIAETLSAMRRRYSSEPADTFAAISPSLGPCCAEFVNFRTELPAALHGYQVRPNYFDFWAISRDQLRTAGVRPENIHVTGICTSCNRDYFSYRRDGLTGRFASVIGLRG